MRSGAPRAGSIEAWGGGKRLFGFERWGRGTVRGGADESPTPSSKRIRGRGMVLVAYGVLLTSTRKLSLPPSGERQGAVALSAWPPTRGSENTRYAPPPLGA